MAMPPADIPPNELWLQITQMPRPFRVVDFPREDPVTGKPVAQLAMMLLTQQEAMTCQLAAEKFARAHMKDDMPRESEARDGYQDLYRNAAAVEVLFRSCKRLEDVKLPFFPSPELMRKNLSQDEIGVLSMSYNRVRAELGPYVTELTKEQLDAWLKVLSQGGNADFLDFLSSEAKSELIVHLASHLSSYTMSSTSLGEQLETSTSESSSALELANESGGEA